MRNEKTIVRHLLSILFVVSLLLFNVPDAHAHCDALDGPVVRDAREALAQRDIMPVLKWIHAADEPEVRSAFEQTLIVREKGPESRVLADRYFFETVVRLHRASEGEPYTGLKPAGMDPGPAVLAADQALKDGEVDKLIRHFTAEVEQGLRERFEHAHRARAHAEQSVEAGRAYVESYVEFVHYAKRLLQDATHNAVHGQEQIHVIH